MKRIVKFRGKSVQTGEWFYGYLQKYQETHASRLCICAASIRTWKDALLYEVIPETIGQFIGISDSDGNEIYEGDIIMSDEGVCMRCKCDPADGIVDDMSDKELEKLLHNNRYHLKLPYVKRQPFETLPQMLARQVEYRCNEAIKKYNEKTMPFTNRSSMK